MSASRLAVCTVVIAISPGARVQANSLFEGLGPREIAVGESMRAEAKGAAATALNPSGLALSRELVFESSYGRKGSDDTNVVTVSACDSTVPVPGCFYYRYLSAEPELGMTTFNRRAHEAGYVAARSFSPQIVLGATYKYFDYNSDLDGEGDAAGHSADIGFTFVPSRFLRLGAVGYNVLSSTSSPNYPRAFGTGLLIRPMDQLALSADATWNTDLEGDDGKSRYGGGVEYFFLSGDQQAGYPVRVGGVRDNVLDANFLTGGVGLRTPRVGLDIGIRKELSGDELLIIGSIRVFGGRPAGAR
jgi:hypothetical protein